ncbi:hypothetical protein GTQ34_06405 [Muricauda sp. JGD-17]|uniref:Lipoprotein n=1 Tax=Flagellimonas ochracea TaxID=2696472 RepID=A0A964TB12_9FLAO|nr:hypothetical protein [Allomuricauda ochracea]NAY91543.1 hypothetical protein [Allomuricauda ochracea]
MRDWIWMVAILLLAGCSTDDDSTLDASKFPGTKFTVIGEDLNKVYQFSYDSEMASATTFDLTLDMGVETDYLTLRQTGDLLSFYSFFQGKFSIALKELTTGDIRVFEDFYTNTPERSITWGINNSSNVFFGYFGPFDSPNLGLQDVQLEGPESEDVVVDFNVGATFDPMLFDERLYMPFRDNLGNYKLTFYDLDSKVLGPTLSFGLDSFGFFITQNGDLAIIKNDSNSTLELYDALDLSFQESIVLNITLGSSIGAIHDAILIGDELYFNFIYPQPSRFVEGPAIYNLNTMETKLVDIGGLVNQVEAEIEKSVLLINQVFDPLQRIFLIGYGTSGDVVEGGVMVASETGELLDLVSLPFFPTYFVRN